jgi:hypothetical protein
MPARKSSSTRASARAPKSSASAEAAGTTASAPATRKSTRRVTSSVTGATRELADTVTTITARIDLGFGNHLYIRGDGPELSWDRGVAAENSGPDLWSLKIRNADRPFSFKCLINDEIWCSGGDFVASPGGSIVVTPTFD